VNSVLANGAVAADAAMPMMECAPGAAHGSGVLGPHPSPRPGITGKNVLTAAQLAEHEELIPLFDGIRRSAAIADGIRCNCGCASLPGYYSLLSCFEGDAMAKICPICKGQGRLAVRMHGEGKSLAEIRVAVDAQFG
jgi:hypothetical protein